MDTEDLEEMICKSKLFDSSWYYKEYPDVRLLDINPVKHYIKYGWKLGRSPGPDFDTKAYLQENTDVNKAGINPLEHYLLYGKKEGREAYKVARKEVLQPSCAQEVALSKIFSYMDTVSSRTIVRERSSSFEESLDQALLEIKFVIQENKKLNDSALKNKNEVLVAQLHNAQEALEELALKEIQGC